MRWPAECKYIKKSVWDPNIEGGVKVQEINRRIANEDSEYATILDSQKIKGLFEVKFINSPQHPAHQQYGLFAKKTIRPNTWIIDYCGYITDRSSEDSDYVLKFTNDYAIDAAKMGNEARMINDYRGIAPKPNAEFVRYYDSNSQSFRMGVFSLRSGIAKNTEIVVTYGKGFWKYR
jgi:hypothetical protein